MFSFTKSKEEEKIDDIYIGDLFESKLEKEIKRDIEYNRENDCENEEESKEEDRDYKDIKIRLIPFIFTEKYERFKGFIYDYQISYYSFLNKINNGIISNTEFKEIENRSKYRLAEILYTNVEDIKIELDKFNDSCFVFNCCITVYKKNFNSLIDSGNQTVKYTIEKFKKLHEVDKNFDYFNYLTEFLNMYLKNIYGYCPHNSNISKIIKKDFIYNKNVIPFREIRTKSKDVKKTNTIIETTIMKMGFVFDHVIAR